tara:strand:+ start:421 stop:1113 length:693 start_codon:yes stop_codon:yes gene_type:complete
MDFIALICARGGSKGIPNKNIKIFNGKPLISWSINLAQKISRIKKVIVSTDDKEIAKIAEIEGAIVPFIRPKELSLDDSDEWLVWQHAIKFMTKNNYNLSYLINLPPTSPLRSENDINRCLDEYEKGNSDAIITIAEAYRNPYFNMVSIDKENNVNILMNKKRSIIRRQEAPEVFDVLTVAYVSSFEYVLENSNLFSGKVGYVKINRENSIDIDTPFDFELAEFLSKKNM